MALEWHERYEAMIGRAGTTLMFPGTSDYYAEFGDRLYLVSVDDRKQSVWYLVVFSGGQVAGGGTFDSLDGAKASAETFETNARFAEGFHYAHLKGAPTGLRAEFGRRWADEYSEQGLSGAQAWAMFNAE